MVLGRQGLARVFISYRISDTADITGRLDADLTRTLGTEAVFRDKTRLVGGHAWTTEIEDNARSCRIMLVMVGPGWQEAKFDDGERKGFPRLSDPQDWVRREIELSFDAGNVVIPVLVNNARLPSEAWLANCGLARLPTRQGVRLNGDDYDAHLAALLDTIRKHCPELSAVAGPIDFTAERSRREPAVERAAVVARPPTLDVGRAAGTPSIATSPRTSLRHRVRRIVVPAAILIIAAFAIWKVRRPSLTSVPPDAAVLPDAAVSPDAAALHDANDVQLRTAGSRPAQQGYRPSFYRCESSDKCFAPGTALRSVDDVSLPSDYAGNRRVTTYELYARFEPCDDCKRPRELLFDTETQSPMPCSLVIAGDINNVGAYNQPLHDQQLAVRDRRAIAIGRFLDEGGRTIQIGRDIAGCDLLIRSAKVLYDADPVPGPEPLPAQAAGYSWKLYSCPKDYYVPLKEDTCFTAAHEARPQKEIRLGGSASSGINEWVYLFVALTKCADCGVPGRLTMSTRTTSATSCSLQVSADVNHIGVYNKAIALQDLDPKDHFEVDLGEALLQGATRFALGVNPAGCDLTIADFQVVIRSSVQK